MRVFLVGGAVRDLMMGRDPKDRDFVVVGASEELMLSRGFSKVGADFPVFLHPESGEEYALARRERKTGPGYHGFESEFGPDVTLEQDLLRRDLTINAMAMDPETDALYDPFGGKHDLEAGVLRHVSEAFAEDPVRVLRVARFAARYDFMVAPETRELMVELVDAGELDHLTPERVWAEMEKALMERNPDLFFDELHACGASKVLFPGLGWPLSNALLRAAGQALSCEMRFAVLMMELGQLPAEELMVSLKVPSAHCRLAKRVRHLVERFPAVDLEDAEAALHLMKELDMFRDWAVWLQLHDLVVAFERPELWEFVRTFSAMHEMARAVSFSDLTEDQRNTLRGPNIGLALDELRKQRMMVYP